MEEKTIKIFIFSFEEFLEKVGLKGKGRLSYVSKDSNGIEVKIEVV